MQFGPTNEIRGGAIMNMKLEVVIIPVSDSDRAKVFYEKLGFRLDIDIVNENFRAMQFTPPRSDASIIFGKGVTSARPGSADLVLAVDNVDDARENLIARGVNVSEVFHYAGGPFNNAMENPRVAGRDPEGRSYFSFASFEDPDGNRWLLQEIKERLPGREEVEASMSHGRRDPCSPKKSCTTRSKDLTRKSPREHPKDNLRVLQHQAWRSEGKEADQEYSHSTTGGHVLVPQAHGNILSSHRLQVRRSRPLHVVEFLREAAHHHE